MPAASLGRCVAGGVATVAPAPAVLGAIPAAIDLLTDVERERAARLARDADRTAFVAAHALLRLCCAHLFASPVASTLVQQCDRCGGPHGRGRLLEHPEARVSLAHSGGVVAVAVATTPVGIDVEPLSSARAATSIAHEMSTAAERQAIARAGNDAQAHLMLWVRKEALVKLGSTSLDELSTVDLSALPMDLPAAGHPRGNRWGGCSLVDLTSADPPSIAAVVSRSPIDVVPLDRLASSPFVEELLHRLSRGGHHAGRPGGHRVD